MEVASVSMIYHSISQTPSTIHITLLIPHPFVYQRAKKCRNKSHVDIFGFGIVRNTYRSLKGFYLTPASLPYAERRKESNMFTLTLGPHGIKERPEVPRPESPGLKLKKSRHVSVASEWIIRSGMQLYNEARNARTDDSCMTASSTFVENAGNFGSYGFPRLRMK